MVADAGDVTVFHDDDDIRILNGGYPLRNDQLWSFGIFFKGLADHGVRVRIHGRGGIVQDQDLRLFQQSAGDAQALLLTAGNVAAALLDMGIVAVREAGDEFIGAGQLAGVDQFLVRGAGIAPAQIFP